MATTPEGVWKKKTDRLLKELGVWYFPPQAGPYGSSGIPDRIACVDGLLVGIEVKADKTKKPTPLQEKCMRDIETAGGRCFVVCDEQSLSALRDFIVSEQEKR